MDGKAWAGVDVGKGFHWAHVVDAAGTKLLSCRVENDEADLLALIDEVLRLADDVEWATDQPGGSAALMLALLWERGQKVIYVPGLSVDRAREAYRGESKTERKDARVIADQARMRGDLGRLEPGEESLWPSCSSCSPAGATSSRTGPAPSRGSGRRFWPCSRRWSGC